MKILVLDLGRTIRGGQRQVLYLARHLQRTPGFEPLVCVPRGAPLRPMLEEVGVEVTPLPSGSELDLHTGFQFLRTVRGHRPAVVHTNDAAGATLGAVARMLVGGFSLVHSRRVSYRLKPGWSRRKYAVADAVVAVSEEIREVLVDCGVPAARTRTIHSGIDASLYSAQKRSHAVLTIGAVGALTEQKGFAVLVESLARLQDDASLPAWQCVIAGEGPLLDALRRRTDDLGIADRVRFPGYRDSRDILPDIDILVVPSVDGEGSNAVIKEGWVSATPVIASDLPSNRELVNHERDGLVFRNRDPDDLARAIVRIATDACLADRLVDGGARTVKEFTDVAMARRYVALYEELVSGGSGKSGTNGQKEPPVR